MVGTVGRGFIVLGACDSGESVADPFGDCCDDAVATDAVTVGVGDVDEFAFVADAVGGVVVGPAHEPLTFEGRKASHDGSDTTSADGTGGLHLQRFGNLPVVGDVEVAGVFGVE